MADYTAPTISLTRVSDSTTFEIPRDCQWSERQQSNAIVQEVDHTIGGSAVIWNGRKLGGIPFTLSSREGVWFTKAQAEALVTEATNNMDEKYTITLPTGETKTLCWRHEPGAEFTPVPISDTADMAETVFTGVLRFWE